MEVTPYSPQAVQLRFLSATPELARNGLVQVATTSDFDHASSATVEAGVVLLNALLPETPYYVRAALLDMAALPSDVQLPSGFEFPPVWTAFPGCACNQWPPLCQAAPQTITSHIPVIETVRTQTGTLPGSGNAHILVTGLWLGVNASVIQLQYAGGLPWQPQREYQASSCAVLTPNTQLVCVSVPGVGGGYRFRVVVDGETSAWSEDLLSHTLPSVTSLEGQASLLAASAVRTMRSFSDRFYC